MIHSGSAELGSGKKIAQLIFTSGSMTPLSEALRLSLMTERNPEDRTFPPQRTWYKKDDFICFAIGKWP